MDKQIIIIDGVDVSGCKYYIENNGIEAQGCYELTDLCECNDENEFCDNNPNCHYKNWQRKEQECEELKEQLKEMNEVIRTETTRCNLVNILKTELDQLKAENDELKKIINEAKNSKLDLKSFLVGEAVQNEYEQQLDQLKAEVKSKTEYIQEQRDIINQYSKEIEMYKKCQGKRASKREEELKAELEQEKNWHKTADEISKANSEYVVKLKQTLADIKDIAENYTNNCDFSWECDKCNYSCFGKDILQKISEVEDRD